MAFIDIASTSTGYSVTGSSDSLLVRAGNYVGSSGYAISASGTSTNNDYTIHGYAIGGAGFAAMYLTGKNGTALGTNTIEVGASGVLSGGYGIYASEDRLILTNNGTISGDSYGAILMLATDVNSHSIVNNGTITGASRGIDIRTNGSSINNSGTIHGENSQSIYITDGDNLILNSGTISTASAAVAVYIDGGDNIIDNSGTIVSWSNRAIDLELGNNQITNSGRIISGGDGISAYAGGNSLTNTGEILTDLESVYLFLGGNMLTNSGTISSTTDHAVTFTGNTNRLMNAETGIITGGDDFYDIGVYFFDGANNSAVNHGTIHGEGYGVVFTAAESGLSYGSLINTGEITATHYSGVFATEGGNTINNSGLISSVGISGIQVGAGENVIQNTGEITGVQYGVLVNDSGAGSDQIENHGLISASQGKAIQSYAEFTSIYNSETGEIAANGIGGLIGAIHLLNSDAQIVNEGTISSAVSFGIYSTGANTALNNSGSIDSYGSSIYSLADAPVLRNSGSIYSETGSVVSATGITSNFRLINSGTLTSESLTSRTVHVASTDASNYIVNTGLIETFGYNAIFVSDSGSGSSSTVLRNTGTIAGDISLNTDTILVRSQNGVIDGELTLTGDAASKVFLGDEDNVVIDRGTTADRLDLGGGVDTVSYVFSGSAVHADLGAGRGYSGDARGDRLIDVENLVGGDYDDLLLGSSVANELTGHDGDDILEGRGGDDVLFGEIGNDDLLGGAGADQLIGGTGGDDLTGGADADVFVYETINDSAVTGTGRDRIMDFEQGADLIDLSALGIDDFIFQAAFTGGGTSEVRYQNVGGGAKTLVQIDIDGDGNADSAIIINNAFFNLTADDFALGG